MSTAPRRWCRERGLMKQRITQPTIRSMLLLMVGATALYVAVLVAYATLELQPSASALQTSASILAQQFDSLRTRTRALEEAATQVRRLSSTGVRNRAERTEADSLRRFITRAAEHSVD